MSAFDRLSLLAGAGLVLALALAAPALARTQEAAPIFGTPPPDCGAVHRDYADPSCTTQTRLGTFSLSPPIVQAGQELVGTVGLNGKYPIDWGMLTALGKHSRCGQTDTTCSVKIPKNANTRPYTVIEVGITNEQGRGISKAYYGVVGKDKVGIAGTVANRQGKPARRAIVEMRGKTTYTAVTSPAGAYSAILPAGKYEVATGKARIAACSGTKDPPFCILTHGGVADFTYEPPEHMISGTIKTEKGKPVSAQVVLKGNSDTYTIQADENGHYSDSIPEDSYRIEPKVRGSACLAPIVGKACHEIVIRDLSKDLVVDFIVKLPGLDVIVAPVSPGSPVKSGLILDPDTSNPTFAHHPVPGQSFECLSMCEELAIGVRDPDTKKPVADATATLSTLPVTSPNVVAGDAEGFFCGVTPSGSSECDNPLEVKLDAAGQAKVEYYVPGVVANVSVRLAGRADAPDGSTGVTDTSLVVKPNLVVDRTISVNDIDASAINVGANLLNATALTDVVKKPCDWFSTFKSWAQPQVTAGGVSLGVGSFEDVEGVKTACDSLGTAAEALDLFKSYGQYALMSWFFLRFHIYPIGLGQSMASFGLNGLQLKIKPSLKLSSDFVDSIGTYFVNLAKDSEGIVKKGQPVHLKIYEVTTGTKATWTNPQSLQWALAIVFAPGLSDGDSIAVAKEGYQPQLWLKAQVTGRP